MQSVPWALGACLWCGGYHTLIKPRNQAAYFGTFMTQFKLLFLDLNFIGIWDVSSVIPKFVN